MTGERIDPRVERSRSVILDAALAQFAEHGYLGASLDGVAERARVSKKTVYNVFGDKERLFRAVIGQAIETAEGFSARTAASLADVTDVEPELRDAVVGLARTILTGPVIRLRRLLIGEVDRFPEFADEYYRRAPERMMGVLAQTLARLDAVGRLEIDDAARAAEHLAFLAVGAGLDRALFRPSDRPPESVAAIDARASAGVDAFLAIYAPSAASRRRAVSRRP
ncbi:TetR/AcrR family transcriptional regulator [Nakamurella sp.]|uniref:TetR/AcrR family transcriptional regulator n=1 Tax=Nakamurella sp. TaxID=1869182 RepID=UPI003B3B1E56